MRERDRKGHQLRCFAAGEAEHHSLVARAELGFGRILANLEGRVDALGDVRRLFLDRDQRAAGQVVEPVLGLRVPDVSDRVADDLLEVDVGGRRDLPQDDDETGRRRRLARDSCVRVLADDRIEDRVGDLIAHLVGVPLGHGFRGEQVLRGVDDARHASSCFDRRRSAGPAAWRSRARKRAHFEVRERPAERPTRRVSRISGTGCRRRGYHAVPGRPPRAVAAGAAFPRSGRSSPWRVATLACCHAGRTNGRTKGRESRHGAGSAAHCHAGRTNGRTKGWNRREGQARPLVVTLAEPTGERTAGSEAGRRLPPPVVTLAEPETRDRVSRTSGPASSAVRVYA